MQLFFTKGDLTMGNDFQLTRVELDAALNQFAVNKWREAIRAKTENELSKYALRIIALITLLLKDTEQENLIIDMKYLEGFIGQHGGTVRDQILKALTELTKTKYGVYQDDILVTQMMYLRDFIYDTKTNKITLSLDRASSQYLFNTEGGYGKILWIYTFGMKSKYGQKLYELIVLEKFRKTKYFTIPIDDLRNMLGLQNKYPNVANFKKKVLEAGIEDINQYTPFNLDYKIKNNIISLYISEKNKIEFEQITKSIMQSKQILDIINSYNSIIESDFGITNEEFMKNKEIIVSTGYLLGSTPEEKFLLSNTGATEEEE